MNLVCAVLLAAMPKSDAKPTPLVFLHGIKGSILTTPEGDTSYLTLSQALGLSTPSLALPLTWENGHQATDALTATEVLGEIVIIPFLWKAAVYQPWLSAARASGRPFYPFAYDWRRSNLENLRRLSAFVNEVRTRHAGAQVDMVGHSMGGMLTYAYLGEHPEAVRRAAIVGSPLRGGIGFLADLHEGESVGRNRALLSPEVLATFPSVYAFFPSDTHQGLVDASGAAARLGLKLTTPLQRS
jgi:pimeloyl-ACP methyl ester carboxylesterase